MFVVRADTILAFQVTLSFLLGWTQTFTLKPNIKKETNLQKLQIKVNVSIELNSMICHEFSAYLCKFKRKSHKTIAHTTLSQFRRDDIMDELMWIIILKKLKGIREELQEHGKKSPYIMLNYYIVCCFFFWEWAFVPVRKRQRKRKSKKKQQRWLLEYIENNGSSRTSDGLFFPYKTRQKAQTTAKNYRLNLV